MELSLALHELNLGKRRTAKEREKEISFHVMGLG